MPGSLSTRNYFLPSNEPCGSALIWPPKDYFARGTPQYSATKFTTYGYELALVKGPGGRLMQRPRPTMQSASRPRYDACLIRPERSLSVKQIVAGEYFCRPDPEAFARLLTQQRQAAWGKAVAEATPEHAGHTSSTSPLFDGAAIWDGLGTANTAGNTVASEPSLGNSQLLATATLQQP
jgi:hypothetical protein